MRSAREVIDWLHTERRALERDAKKLWSQRQDALAADYDLRAEMFATAAELIEQFIND
jgi:hypothetical protein